MDFFYRFPVSGVETYIFLPPVLMFLVSCFTSMGGVSGAFVLLPFQMNLFHYTSPGASATNFVYNIVAIPLGVCRYIRRRSMAWSLLWLLSIGSLPGVFCGYYIRVRYLPDPHHFKLFVGVVLAYLSMRIFQSVFCAQDKERDTEGHISGGRIGWRRTTIVFGGEEHSFRTAPLLLLSLAAGAVGGVYGIGGGSIIVPFCIVALRLPVRAISGAILCSTWTTSLVAALFYALAPLSKSTNASPDWLLGTLFGLGGMAGIYAGTYLQKLFPPRVIKAILAAAILFVSIKYLAPIFMI